MRGTRGSERVINLNYRDSRPIYEQIRDEMRRLILSGALGAEEKLPSVRELASGLAINPNTIQRAYRELEAEGFIYSVAGKGSFVANAPPVDGARKDRLLEQLRDTARELRFLGMTEEELIAVIRSCMEREEEKHD